MCSSLIMHKSVQFLWVFIAAGVLGSGLARAEYYPGGPLTIPFYVAKIEQAEWRKIGFYAYTNEHAPVVDVYLKQTVTANGDLSYTGITNTFSLTSVAQVKPEVWPSGDGTYSSITSGTHVISTESATTTYAFSNPTGVPNDNQYTTTCIKTDPPSPTFPTRWDVAYALPDGGIAGWTGASSAPGRGPAVEPRFGGNEFMEAGEGLHSADYAVLSAQTPVSETYTNTSYALPQYQTVTYNLENIYSTHDLKERTFSHFALVPNGSTVPPGNPLPGPNALNSTSFTSLLHYPAKDQAGVAYTQITASEVTYKAQKVVYYFTTPALSTNEQYLIYEEITVKTNDAFYKAYSRIIPAKVISDDVNVYSEELAIEPRLAGDAVVFNVGGYDLCGEIARPGPNAEDIATTSIALTKVAFWRRSDFEFAKPCLSGSCAEGCEKSLGMPTWGVSEPDMSVWLKDTPVSYKTSLGEEISFDFVYNQRDPRMTNSAVPVTGWAHNWYSYIHFWAGTETNSTQLDFGHWTALAYLPGGLAERFRYNQNVHPDSQDVLSVIGPLAPTNGGFVLSHPDGSADIYRLVSPAYHQPEDSLNDLMSSGTIPLGAFAYDTAHHYAARSTYLWREVEDWSALSNPPEILFMDAAMPRPLIMDLMGATTPNQADALWTEHVDKFGNTIHLYYAAATAPSGMLNYFLSQVVDYDGKTNQFTYVNRFLSSVTCPGGKVASLVYDGSGRLQSITDAQGLSSSMTYQGAVISSLTTPYGETDFDVLSRGDFMGFAEGGSNVLRAVTITNPNHSRELYLYRFDSSAVGIGSSLPAPLSMTGIENITWDNGENLADNDNNGVFNLRNSFYWGPNQTPLLSSANPDLLNALDYQLARLSHWRLGRTEGTIGGSPSAIRGAAPDTNSVGAVTWYYDSDTLSPYQMTEDLAIRPASREKITAIQLSPAAGNPAGTRYTDTVYLSGLPTQEVSTYSLPDGSVGTRLKTLNYTNVNNSLTVDGNSAGWSYKLLTGVTGYNGESLLKVNPVFTNQTVTFP